MRKILTVLLFCFCLAGAGAQNGRPSVALVLGGGAARGFAHIAVLEMIDELGIPVDMVAGVSSGAIVGGLYAAGYSPAMILEAFENRDWPSYFSDGPVSPFWNRSEELPLFFSLHASNGAVHIDLGKGYSSGQMVYGLFKSLTAKIPSYLDFDKLPIPFRAGVTETPSGKFKLLSEGDLAEAIRASMSIQGIFEPFVIDGNSYTDGGLLNNLPVREVREMGFDIVIAVDLFAVPETIAIEPTELPNLIATLYMYGTSKEHHAFADVVVFPLLSDVSAVDFNKGREIYELARVEREKFAAALEPIREMTANSRPASYGNYKDAPSLTPQKLIVEGALPRDRSFIERAFSRLVRDKALEEENVTVFLERVYETGNYHMATMRTCLRGGETCLELTLFPETQNKLLFRATGDYEGTFSSRSFDRAALKSGIEYRHKNGFSLLLKTSILDEISAGLSMFQPLSPYFFLSMEADLVREQDLTLRGLLGREEVVLDRLLYFRGNLKGGLRFNRHNSLTLWPEYFWLRNEDQHSSMAGIAAAYTFSSLDHSLFPSRGFRGRVENHVRLVPETVANDFKPFDLVSVDLTGAIPLGRGFSLRASGFASSLFGAPELLPEFSTFEIEKAERIYFPHASGIFFGEKRAALGLALRFEPLESLTILGGKLLFFLSAAVGRASSSDWNAWADFGKDKLIWNASLGTAMVPLRYMGLQLRAGAGGGGGRRAAPFISLDVGMSRFEKGLF